MKEIIRSITLVGQGFNLQAFKDLITPYTGPITEALLWLTPIFGVIACAIVVIHYFTRDEMERERHRPERTIKKIIALTVFAESIQAIMKVFGIT